MYKNTAIDITGDISFEESELTELNNEIGIPGFFQISERGGGDAPEIILNIAIDIISGLATEVLISIIKAVYKKAKHKIKTHKERNEFSPIVIINCENYDCNNSNLSFTINMYNSDEEICASVKSMKTIADNYTNKK